MNLTPEQQRAQLIAIQNSLSMQNNITVLIVDDETEDSYLTKERLSRFGITAVIADSGDVALQMIEHEPFSIIFLDWKLIGRSGMQTLLGVKEKAPNCIVIVLTGATYGEYASQALVNGAAAVMLKPLTEENIKLIFGEPTNIK